MKRALRAPLLLGLLLCVPGCAWFGGDDEEGPAPLLDFEPEARLEVLWRARVGQGLGDRFTRLRPAVVRDRVYAADAYGLVEARALDDGALLWRSRIGVPPGSFFSAFVFWDRDDDGGSFVTGGVAADDYTVYLGTENGELVALRSDDGEELWRVQLSSEILAPAASDGERVFVLTGDGRLTALARSDGARLWSFDTQVPVLTLRGTGSPVVVGPVVLAGFANGRVVALRADEGQVLWEHVVALPAGRSELERMVDVDTTPLPTNSAVYVGSYQGAVKALRVADGNPLWEQPLSLFGRLGEAYGDVYAVDEDGTIHALDAASGTPDWTQPGLARRGVTGAGVVPPELAVGDADGWLHLFALSDGRPIARMRIDGDGVRTAPVPVGGRLLVLGNGGRLVLLDVARER